MGFSAFVLQIEICPFSFCQFKLLIKQNSNIQNVGSFAVGSIVQTL